MFNVCQKKCTGCIKNSMCSITCNIVPCSLNHGSVDYCFECGEYPCDKYFEVDMHDSVMTHINQLKDIQKAKTIGMQSYHKEQVQKVIILKKFLESCKYGGDNEIFFCTAVILLPLEDLIIISENLDNNIENMTLKDKYNC